MLDRVCGAEVVDMDGRVRWDQCVQRNVRCVVLAVVSAQQYTRSLQNQQTLEQLFELDFVRF